MQLWRTKKWWMIAALAIIVMFASAFWFYTNMYDLPRIKSAEGCVCEGIDLEQEVRSAEAIYSGKVTRITRSLKGTYTITVQLEETFKGQIVSGDELHYTVDNRCPYPFQKDNKYVFLQPASSQVSQCSLIINAADIETIDLINRWLNREVNVRDDTGPDDSGEERVVETDSKGAELIFDALVSQLGSVRVEEAHYRTWLYDDADSLFFYSPEARISFFVPIGQPVTQEDYEQFIQGISVMSVSDNKKVAFALGEVSLDVKELPIVIKLFDAPSQDIAIRFRSPNRDEEFEVILQYIEPFTYTVSSASDPGMEQYAEVLKSGYQAVHHVVNGRTHTYTIQFNHPVDRTSVYEKLNESLRQHPTVAWSLLWASDYEVRLSLALDDDATEELQFTLNGVRTESGYQLVARETYVIQPGEPVVFQAIDLETNTKEAYFTSISPYATVDVSPEGSYLLTSFAGNNGIHVVYQYAVRDRFGNVLRQFSMDEIHDPLWISDDTLAYVAEQELKIYQVSNDETSTAWTVPGKHKDEKIVSFDHSFDTGKVAIGSGYTTDGGNFVYDLYILDSLDDPEPAVIESFGSYECIEGQCSAPRILFTEDQAIMHTRWESAAGSAEGYVQSLYRTDLQSLVSRRIETPADAEAAYMMFPLVDGTVLYIADSSPSRTSSADRLAAGYERWSVYDPLSGSFEVLTDSNLGLFTNHWLEQFIPLRASSRQVLLDVYESGWYVLDLDAGQLSEFPGLAEKIDVIDAEMNRIWFME